MKRLVLVLSILSVSIVAHADEPVGKPELSAKEPNPTITDIRDFRSAGWFLAGGLTAFFAHEGGHVVTNLMYGNVPQLQGLWAFGFVPFFAIAPRISCQADVCYTHDGDVFSGGPRGKFVITSAGFNVQHLTDEILLTREPELRYRHGPYRKGILTFNTLLSIGYALASWTGTEDPHGDVSRSASLVGLPSQVYAGALILPALLDLYRYFNPRSRWAPWVSRGSKGVFLGLIFAAPT